ncbi:hypothetical protein TREPR_1738 [Treponema primitia ZAS-2]|uniref:Uncharacterized protein n=1 Tax=Treponema primitia (strain ATCC BAA-887 / DSM 12427 / ZAS-2) TaxID=545694 RepID=F5YMT2_TREPZ|nr:hypothetical protein TREPR_1738 [Treponema primitia ZAS-2]
MIPKIELISIFLTSNEIVHNIIPAIRKAGQIFTPKWYSPYIIRG